MRGPPRERIVAFDVARALATFAMVVVNFKTVMVDDPTAAPLLVGLCAALDGRAVAVFVVLAGVGTSLTRDSADSLLLATLRRRLRRRALVLFLFGLVFSLLWPADILHFYGAYLFVASWVVDAKSKRLWQLACFFILGFVALALSLDYESGWNFETLEYADFWAPMGFLRRLLFNGFHPLFPWFSLYLLGMWLGRQDLRDSTRRRTLLRRSFAVALTVEGGVHGLRGTLALPNSALTNDPLQFFASTGPLPPTPAYILAAGGTAVVLIILCVELCERPKWSNRLEGLASIGRSSLTLYVGHVVFVILPLLWIGQLYHRTLESTLILAAVFCVTSSGFILWWTRHLGRGPMERLFRLFL